MQCYNNKIKRTQRKDGSWEDVLKILREELGEQLVQMHSGLTMEL